MATPRKGPSFSGPAITTGWTAASLTPTTTVAATTDPLLTEKLAEKGWTFRPGSGWTSGAPTTINPDTGKPFSYGLAGPNDINPLTLSPLSDETIRARERWAGIREKLGISSTGSTITDDAITRGLIASGELGGGGGGSGGGSDGGGGSTDAMRGRSTPVGGRGTNTNPTPLESLLASIFPDAVAGSDPAPPNPYTNAPQPSALFRTILGNLSSSGGGFGPGAPAVPAPVAAPAGFPSASANIAATIPGAPPFLASAINNVQGFGLAPQPVAAPVSIGNNLAGIAALAAEQRAQTAAAEKARLEARNAYFQQQQKQQKAAALAAQRQRQRFGGVNAITSGWANNPLLF